MLAIQYWMLMNMVANWVSIGRLRTRSQGIVDRFESQEQSDVGNSLAYVQVVIHDGN